MKLCLEECAASSLRPGDRILYGGVLRDVASIDPLTLDPHGDRGWPEGDRSRVEVVLPREHGIRPDRLLHRPGDLLLMVVPA